MWENKKTYLLKTQISLRIHGIRLKYSLSAWRNFASLAIQNAPSEDSDQTAHLRSLIWIFAGRTCQKVRFLTLRPLLCHKMSLASKIKEMTHNFTNICGYATNDRSDQLRIHSLIMTFSVSSIYFIVFTDCWSKRRSPRYNITFGIILFWTVIPFDVKNAPSDQSL